MHTINTVTSLYTLVAAFAAERSDCPLFGADICEAVAMHQNGQITDEEAAAYLFGRMDSARYRLSARLAKRIGGQHKRIMSTYAVTEQRGNFRVYVTRPTSAAERRAMRRA